MKHLKIAYACNDRYIEQTGISLISLLENNKHFEEIEIYLISKEINNNNLNIISSICRAYNRKLIIINFNSIAFDLNISNLGRHIETIYAKIFFERIPNLNKILYIDSDTIINGTLDTLWDIELAGYYMGMVETYTGHEAKKKLRLPTESLFFNDGVALINVDYCRKHNLINKCLTAIDFYKGNPPVLSEGLLNKICNGKILKISPRYNMMTGLYHLLSLSPKYVEGKLSYDKIDLEESFKNPIIIHFLSGFYNRPWMKYCNHPLKYKFLDYKKISPWNNVPLKEGKLSLKIRVLGFLLNFVGPKNFERLRKLFNNVSF